MSVKLWQNRLFLLGGLLIGLGVSAVFLFGYLTTNRNEGGAQPPGDMTDPFQLGQYYFNHGDEADGTYDLKLARKYFEEVVRENPTGNNLAWYQLGRIDFLEGKYDAAIYKFNRQVEYFDREIPNVDYMYGLTYGYKARAGGGEKDWQKAEEYFQRFLDYNEFIPWTRVDLAWVYFSQGKYEEMKPLLERGIELWPGNAWMINMYGLALLNTGDKEGAREQFLMAKEIADGILTVEDWGKTYPGNDPAVWEEGLEEFRRLIDHNLSLTE